MEQFIILLIIWLLVSVFNSLAKKSKQQKSRSRPGTAPQPRQSRRSASSPGSTQEESEPAELDIPPFLREMLGMETPQPTRAPSPSVPEPEVREEYEPTEAELPPVDIPEETIPVVEAERMEAGEAVESAGMIPYHQKQARRSELVPGELFQPDALKRAILLKEILGEPVSRRMMPGIKLHDG